MKVGAGQTLTLNDDTVTGTTFTDTATGAIIQIDDGTTLTLSGATIYKGEVDNFGTVDATSSSEISTVQLSNKLMKAESGATLTLHADTITNSVVIDTVPTDGTIEALTGGTVFLQYTNVTGGTIEAAGGTVDIYSTTITGSTLESSDGGVIEVVSHWGSGLDGVTIASGTTVAVISDSFLGLADTIDNLGTIALYGSATALSIYDTVTLTGGGSVTLGGGAILSSNSAAHLINYDTISGSGFITLIDGLVNYGTIEATGGTFEIVLNATTVNAGTLSAAADGTLFLYGGPLTNTDGTIDVAGTLQLQSTTITGGTINNFSLDDLDNVVAGTIDVTGNSTISGASLNNGDVTVATGTVLTLDNDTVTGTAFTGADGTSIIQVDGGTTLDAVGRHHQRRCNH